MSMSMSMRCRCDVDVEDGGGRRRREKEERCGSVDLSSCQGVRVSGLQPNFSPHHRHNKTSLWCPAIRAYTGVRYSVLRDRSGGGEVDPSSCYRGVGVSGCRHRHRHREKSCYVTPRPRGRAGRRASTVSSRRHALGGRGWAGGSCGMRV